MHRDTYFCNRKKYLRYVYKEKGEKIMSNREILFDLINEQLEGERVTLDEELRLVEDLQFDSIQIMGLLIAVEDTFGIQFDNSKLLFDNFDRIGDLLDIIDQLQ